MLSDLIIGANDDYYIKGKGFSIARIILLIL